MKLQKLDFVTAFVIGWCARSPAMNDIAVRRRRGASRATRRCVKPSGIASRRPEPRSIGQCASCRSIAGTGCTLSTPFAARSTTSPTASGRSSDKIAALAAWREEIDALYAGHPHRLVARALSETGAALSSAPGGFPGHYRRHGDGRARRYSRARSCDARPLLRACRECRRPSLGSRFRRCERCCPRCRRIARPRVAADQYSPRSRRGRGARAALSAPRDARSARDSRRRPRADLAASGAAGSLPRRGGARRSSLSGSGVRDGAVLAPGDAACRSHGRALSGNAFGAACARGGAIPRRA